MNSGLPCPCGFSHGHMIQYSAKLAYQTCCCFDALPAFCRGDNNPCEIKQFLLLSKLCPSQPSLARDLGINWPCGVVVF